MVINNNNNNNSNPDILPAASRDCASRLDLSALGNERNRMTMIAIAVTFGWAGCHKYYVGKWTQGVVYLVLSLIGAIGLIILIRMIFLNSGHLTSEILLPPLLGAAVLLLPLAASFAEAIYWLFQSDQRFDERYKSAN